MGQPRRKTKKMGMRKKKKKKKKRRRARKSFRFLFALCCPHLPASLPSLSPPLRKDHPWWQLYLFCHRIYLSVFTQVRDHMPLTFYLLGSPFICRAHLTSVMFRRTNCSIN